MLERGAYTFRLLPAPINTHAAGSTLRVQGSKHIGGVQDLLETMHEPDEASIEAVSAPHLAFSCLTVRELLEE